MFILGKIKTYIIAALAVLLPILYVFGRRDGKKLEQQKILKDELEASQSASDFYKAMAEHEDDFNPVSRNDLTDRLRRDGL
jgi:uncharacterized membrane-anchored protein YhcB (DUF1043 family)